MIRVEKDKKRKHLEVVLYPADGWTKQKILEEISKRGSIQQYAIMLHDKDVQDDGSPKPEHYHVYLNFGKASWTPAEVAKWFEIKPELVQMIKSNKATVLRYFLHENCPDKHQYPLDDMVANFDVEAFLQQQKQSASLDTLLRQCSDGKITRLNYTQYIDPVIFAKHQRKFESAWAFCQSALVEQDGNGSRQMSILWLYGDTAVGKSLLCKLLARNQQRTIYLTSTGSDPFGEYKGQSVVVLDDLRPEMPFSFAELLKITDPYNSSGVHSRYHNKHLVCDQLIITAPMSPEEYTAQCYLPHEDAAQLYRRLSEVWKVTKSDIYISRYDLGLGSFMPISVRPNPVPAYLATLSPSAPAFDGGSILTQLNAQYAPPSGAVVSAPSAGVPTPGGFSAAAADDEKEVLPF